VILATDDDGPGRILRDELAIRLKRTRCWYVKYPPGCKDANDVLQAFGPSELGTMLREARPIVPSSLVPFSDIPVRAEQQRYSSGWSGLDPHLMIVPPELVVVTGTPGAGKSQWTLALVANLARVHGLKGAILQFEDNPERNRRDLLAYAESWVHQPQRGVGGDPAAWVDRMFRTIAPAEDLDEATDFNLAWLHAAIEEAATRHGAKWILIDPWNEVEHVWRINETETAYTNQALRDLKRLARRYQLAIIVVAHPTKGAGAKSVEEVSLYDISGSAAWKNKADHGIIVHRLPTDPETTIKIDKSKDFWVMGAPGAVRMRYQPRTASFEFVGPR
jgi:twinkle protein